VAQHAKPREHRKQLDGGGNLLVSLSMQKPGLYVGSQSGLEFVMKLS